MSKFLQSDKHKKRHAGLQDVLAQFIEAGKTGDFNISLNTDGLDPEDAGIVRSISEALRAYQSATEFDLMKYRLTCDALGIALWYMDVSDPDPTSPANKIIWSEEFYRMLGFLEGEDFPVGPANWSDRLHPDDRARALIAWDSHINDYSGKTPYDIEYRLLVKNGEYRYFRVFGTTLRSGEGRPLRVSGAMLDITDKMNAQKDRELVLEAEERMRLMIDAAPLAITMWDEDLNFIDCSAKTVRIFGYPDKQTLAEHFMNLLPEYQPDGRLSTEVMSEAFGIGFEKGYYRYEAWHGSLSGELIPFDVPLVRIKYQGKAAIIAYSRDLRDQKAMMRNVDNALAEAKNTLANMENILNNADAMIYVSDPVTHEIIFITEQMKRHFGIKRDVIGEKCYHVFNAGVDRRCDWCPCDQLDKNPDEAVVWEEHNTLTNGYYRNTERYIDWPGGQKVHIQYRADLTDIKDTAKRLEGNNNLLSLVNYVADILLKVDTDNNDKFREAMEFLGNLLKVDRVRIWRTGIRDSEAHFIHQYEWASEFGRQASKTPEGLEIPFKEIAEWAEMFSNNQHLSAVYSELPQKYQEFVSRFAIKSIAVLPSFINGEFVGVVSIDDCQTERVFTPDEMHILNSVSLMFFNAFYRIEQADKIKKALVKAHAANKTKSEFLSRMSHEMRTPMNAIINMLRILQTSSEQAKKERCVQNVDKASRYLLKIIDDVLNFAELRDREGVKLDYSAFSFKTMIQEVARIIEFHTEEKRQAFSIYIDPLIPDTIICDKKHLTSVLHSLLFNATKFTHEKGLIKLKARLANEEEETLTLQIEVSDNGIGISEQDQKKIFDAFEQVDGGIGRQYGGIGLGLSMAKQIIELMGGGISLESEPGKGSKFTFTFKAERQYYGMSEHEDTEKPAVKAEPERQPDIFPYSTALVVDDVAINREILAAVLEATRINIEHAENGRQAVDLFISDPKKYDIIFMDINMPVMDGIEATRKIRTRRGEGAKVPILAVTANSHPEEVEKYIKAGMDGYLCKPVDFEDLLQYMNTHLKPRKKHIGGGAAETINCNDNTSGNVTEERRK